MTAAENPAVSDTPAFAVDPVCGMKVDLSKGKPTFDYKGVTYHFCGNGCRTKFAGDPEMYLARAAAREWYTKSKQEEGSGRKLHLFERS